jgi:hypothetical protein
MGGNAVTNVGPIHIDEIGPTIEALEQALGIKLRDNTLGSVGKKDISGDIDIAIDIKVEDRLDFIEHLKTCWIVHEVSLSSVASTKVEIVNYNPDVKADNRTGYVQVDFMFGDPEWLKLFYHSPSQSESKWKGAHRNAMICAITQVHKYTTREGITWRYSWSPKRGLIYVRREPKIGKNGRLLKATIETPIHGPYRTASGIIDNLGLNFVNDLTSYESLRDAVKLNYSPVKAALVMEKFRESSHLEKMGGIPQD